MLGSLFVNRAAVREEIDMIDIIENHETDMFHRYKRILDSHSDKLDKMNIRMELKLVRSVNDRNVKSSRENFISRPSLVEGYQCNVACIANPANGQSTINQSDNNIITEWCISAITRPFFEKKINLFVDTSDAEKELDLYIKRASGDNICS